MTNQIKKPEKEQESDVIEKENIETSSEETQKFAEKYNSQKNAVIGLSNKCASLRSKLWFKSLEFEAHQRNAITERYCNKAAIQTHEETDLVFTNNFLQELEYHNITQIQVTGSTDQYSQEYETITIEQLLNLRTKVINIYNELQKSGKVLSLQEKDDVVKLNKYTNAFINELVQATKNNDPEIQKLQNILRDSTKRLAAATKALEATKRELDTKSELNRYVGTEQVHATFEYQQTAILHEIAPSIVQDTFESINKNSPEIETFALHIHETIVNKMAQAFPKPYFVNSDPEVLALIKDLANRIKTQKDSQQSGWEFLTDPLNKQFPISKGTSMSYSDIANNFKRNIFKLLQNEFAGCVQEDLNMFVEDYIRFSAFNQLMYSLLSAKGYDEKFVFIQDIKTELTKTNMLNILRANAKRTLSVAKKHVVQLGANRRVAGEHDPEALRLLIVEENSANKIARRILIGLSQIESSKRTNYLANYFPDIYYNPDQPRYSQIFAQTKGLYYKLAGIDRALLSIIPTAVEAMEMFEQAQKFDNAIRMVSYAQSVEGQFVILQDQISLAQSNHRQTIKKRQKTSKKQKKPNQPKT